MWKCKKTKVENFRSEIVFLKIFINLSWFSILSHFLSHISHAFSQTNFSCFFFHSILFANLTQFCRISSIKYSLDNIFVAIFGGFAVSFRIACSIYRSTCVFVILQENLWLNKKLHNIVNLRQILFKFSTYLTQNHPILTLAVHMQSQLSQLPNPIIQTAFSYAKRIEASDYQITICSRVVLLPHHWLFVQLIRQHLDCGIVEFVWWMLVIAAAKEISESTFIMERYWLRSLVDESQQRLTSWSPSVD